MISDALLSSLFPLKVGGVPWFLAEFNLMGLCSLDRETGRDLLSRANSSFSAAALADAKTFLLPSTG